MKFPCLWSTVVWHQIVTTIPTSIFTKQLLHGSSVGLQDVDAIDGERAEAEDEVVDNMGERGHILWIRGLSRLQHQVNHVTWCDLMWSCMWCDVMRSGNAHQLVSCTSLNIWITSVSPVCSLEGSLHSENSGTLLNRNFRSVPFLCRHVT